jgi:hypothetical protein
MRKIVIQPGGYHPFHAGHYALYKSAQNKFPDAEIFLAATDDTKTRPFPFEIKKKLAQLAGVSPNNFIQVKSPFRPQEITSKYDPENDILIFVRSEKDRNEEPKPGGTKKDGSPSYFQPYDETNLQPFGKHAYIEYLPTVEFGPGIKSATEIRNSWPGLNERQKLAMVMSLYPATQKNKKLADVAVKMLDAGIIGDQLNEEGVTEGKYGGEPYTFNQPRRQLNVPELIKRGAIFVTYPHGEQGWETDDQEDWSYSLISLYNVMQGGWTKEAKKYIKPASYKKAEQQINSSAPNLGKNQLVYDGKYNQILWSIEKLNIPDSVAFLDNQDMVEGGAETSWSDDTDTITLQDMLELTKHIKQINLPINDKLKSKLVHWDGNPEEIERINQVTVSKQFPILVMLDEKGQIDWILDGNHRLHKAIQSQAETIPAKLIRPSDLNDKAKKIFYIRKQGVTEAKLEEDMLTEAMLYEGFLDSAKQYLGNRISSTTADIQGAVVDMKSAGILIKDIIQDADYLDKVNIQLFKQNRMLIKTITQLLPKNEILANFWNKIKQRIMLFIEKKGWLGFLSRLGVYGFLKYIVAQASNLTDIVISTITDKLAELVKVVVNPTMATFLAIFNSLKTVKEYFLDVLTSIKTKLMFTTKDVAEATLINDPEEGHVIIPDGGMGSYDISALQSKLERLFNNINSLVKDQNYENLYYILYKSGVLENALKAIVEYKKFMEKQGKRPIAKKQEIDISDYLNEK